MTLDRRDILTKHPKIRSHANTFKRNGYVGRSLPDKNILVVVLYDGNQRRLKGYLTIKEILTFLEWNSEIAKITNYYPKR